MSNYLDHFIKLSKSDLEVQGLLVKLPFMESFCPVLDVEPVPEDPDFLKVVISANLPDVRPRISALPAFRAEGVGCLNYFIHKSQVIFRTCERCPDMPTKKE